MLSPGRSPGRPDAGAGPNNIRVVARFRPLSALETKEDARSCAKVDGGRVEVATQPGSEDGTTNVFFFPLVYGASAPQSQVFDDIGVPVLRDVLAGYNGTVFVYGQTGSGKTFTMLGPFGTAERLGVGTRLEESAGLMPRVVQRLFEEIENVSEAVEFRIAVSYVEVYKEKVRDLLNRAKGDLQVRENPGTASFYVNGATKIYVTSPAEILKILSDGNLNRATASTKINEHSSRSHSVLSIEVKSSDSEKGEQKTGKLFLVDLAGSERVAKTRAEGEVFDEARQINLSLTTLGLVIKDLSEVKSHIPYRNSVLTKLLMDSLGGNSKTTLICCCSPSAYNGDETLSTLRFGARAANIKNHPIVNAELTPEELKVLLLKAQRELEALRSGRIPSEPSTMVLDTKSAHLAVECESQRQLALELQSRAAQLDVRLAAVSELYKLAQRECEVWAQEYSTLVAHAISLHQRSENSLSVAKASASALERLQAELGHLRPQLEHLAAKPSPQPPMPQYTHILSSSLNRSSARSRS